MKKSYLTILIVLLVVGFATVTANLILNGTVSILADQEAFAKDVIFTKAKIKGGSAVIENEGKSITFISPTIKSLGEETILDFTITNYNRQYDAEATIKCDFVKENTLLGEEDFSEYIDVKTDETSYFIPASGNTPGQVISTLKKSYTEEQVKEVKIECTLIVEAKSKDYLEDELVRPNSDNTIKNVPNNYTGEFWAYKSVITNIVFENELNPHTGNNVEVYNISESGTGTVMAYYDKDAKTVYIQGDGNIFANKDSSYLFSNFTNLKTIDGLEDFNIFYTKNMDYMFYNCTYLEELDLSSFDTSNITSMYSVFQNCKNLVNIEGISDWDTSRVTTMENMFQNCSKLTSLDLSNWDTPSLTNMSNMFNGCSKLVNIEGINNLATSRVIAMSSIFSGCSALTELDLSGWNTSVVKYMGAMFNGCSKLTTIKLSNWDTSSATDMNSMFRYCSKLVSLDLSSWNVSSVTNMSSMFYFCSSLIDLNLNNWNTSSLKNLSWTFQGCSSLQSLLVNHFNTSSVTTMSGSFNGCSALIELDLSSWNTSNVSDMMNLFLNCIKLKTINISNFNTSKVTAMQGVFNGCISLESLESNNFDISKLVNSSNMFNNCNNLTTTITIINLPPAEITYDNMFLNAATVEGTQIKVNYTSENEALINEMFTTVNGNVVKGDDISS